MRKRVINQPLIQPKKARDDYWHDESQCHANRERHRKPICPGKIIGAKAPEIAIKEPTERSIPAVPMTNVMPTATITMVQTCVRFTLSVCQLTKCGVKNRLNSISAKSAASVPRRRR